MQCLDKCAQVALDPRLVELELEVDLFEVPTSDMQQIGAVAYLFIRDSRANRRVVSGQKVTDEDSLRNEPPFVDPSGSALSRTIAAALCAISSKDMSPELKVAS